MTFEEMITYLLETYPSDRYRGDELMDYITAEIKAAEARGVIGPIEWSGLNVSSGLVWAPLSVCSA